MISKYLIGDTIYYMDSNKPKSGIVRGISNHAGVCESLYGKKEVVENEVLTCYYIGMYTVVEEKDTYATMLELKESLFPVPF